MRTTRTSVVGTLLLLALLLPKQTWARTQTILGSVTILNATFSAPASDLVGIAVIHSPGFAKSTTQPLPPLTAPFFVDVDKDDTTGKVVNSRAETTLILTNTGGATTIGLIVRDAVGSQFGQNSVTLAGFGTVTIDISALLP
ncbi:MAG: hypothetical protein HY278_04735 [candidate division NC10 bacterium]|nr:hypothetical protein [candidate division NC10 bacterium]